ncbi:MAG: asparagine synthase (glutamine-hydrolyzing) [Nitrospinaceae bacterium]
MCGLAGFLDPHWTEPAGLDCLRKMGATLSHRGPDDGGTWFDPEGGVGLAHRRLSVQDTSLQGHQPMVSASGRYVIVYNGEIYNFKELRQNLESNGDARNTVPAFRGHSDTEVLLAAVERWGLWETIHQWVGMFAFALWDREKRRLHLVRDRLGIKPLYYGYQKGAFLFGSELKALREHPRFQGRVDRNALTLMMRHNHVPAPYSIYEGIYKLLPGTMLTVDGSRPGVPLAPVTYWSAREAMERGMENPFQGSETEAIKQLDTLLRDAVKLRMISDVPLGAFLSGGVDSSLIVSLMQDQSSLPVRTFSIGFDDKDFNEAPHARAVAKYLGTDHTELYVTPETAMEIIPRLSMIYDEPFADPSQIPTFLVSRMTRKHVTVSLSGDGGDELFAGYNRYLLGRLLRKTAGRLPYSFRNFLSKSLSAVPPAWWNRLASPWIGRVQPRWRQAQPAYLMHKLAEFLPFQDQESFYRGLTSYWNEPELLVKDSREPAAILNQVIPWKRRPDFTHWMMFVDTVSFLPDDILTKVDRASMAVGLETRIPLLDHRVVEFACGIPAGLKIRNRQGKWILKQVLHRYLPPKWTDRPKMGFSVPIGAWLSGPLRDWAEDLLDETRLKQEGFFNPAPIRKIWASHKTGTCNWQYSLWNVLMFQAWLRNHG